MIKNEVLQKKVQDAIKWEPLLNAAEIGVTVKDGIVTLSGQVDSYIKKSEAEIAAKNVEGVKAVVEKIEIKFGNHHFKKDDNEIATDLVDALKWNWEVPNDKVHIKVENAWVTLDGELEWNYQKEAAKKAVSNQIGVLGVTNNLTIKSDMHDKIEKTNIELALNRNWSIDDKDISVVVTGNNVTLNGTVKSIYQSDESERIAWNAPGVWTVNNNLQVETTF
jgi:osmotically-inducible protein OsmY